MFNRRVMMSKDDFRINSSNDYIVNTPDGGQVLIEVKNKEIPSLNVENMTEEELSIACAEMFMNLGWKVERENIVHLEKEIFRPDLTLSDGNKDVGYVEIVTSSNPKELVRKKEQIQIVIDKFKPDLFILTNGMVYDIFINGKYTDSVTTPPSIYTIQQRARLFTYYEAFMNLYKKKGEDNE